VLFRSLLHLPALLKGLVWRLLFGFSASASLRRDCARLFAPQYRAIIEAATVSELSVLVTCYTGLERAYFAEMMSDVQLRQLSVSAGPAIARVAASQHGAIDATPTGNAQDSSGVMTPLVTGEPLPHVAFNGALWGAAAARAKADAQAKEGATA